MLKGTTKIELTDVCSGEKEVIEKQNMFTNAVSNLFQPVFGHLTDETTLRGYIPAHTELLGGILLFDTTIEEDANTIYPPAGTKLTACGKYNYVNSTRGQVVGSYNVNESSFDSQHKKMTFVYDFNTSQGNGTIASICLTSAEAGYGFYGSDYVFSPGVAKSLFLTPKRYIIENKDTTGTISIGNYEYLFLIDADNDFVYYLQIVDATHLKIKKKYLGIKRYSLFTNNIELVEDIELAALSEVIRNTYITYNYDHATNCLYIFSNASSTIDPNGSFLITKIYCDSWTVNQYTMTNTTNTSITSSGRWAFAHQGYVYLKSNTPQIDVYRIEIGMTANVLKFDSSVSVTGVPVFALSGKVYYQIPTNSTSGSIFIADSELLKVEVSGNATIYTYTYSPSYTTYYATPAFTPVKNHEMFYYLTYNSQSLYGFFYISSYLATINNLTEQVTKTIDKTMKVTYVIEEV